MSQSIACHHFPQIVWREGEKFLWNPVHRQALKNLPEERLRLRILEYLLQGGWSKHRISTEEAVNLPQREAKHRTDLICYAKNFTPYLLVECKAENVKLSAKTAEQIARYNRQIQAPFLLMSNGRVDYWYHLNNDKSVEQLPGIPSDFPPNSKPPANFNYWKSRGFAGASASPKLRRWLEKMLDAAVMNITPVSLQHLSFKTNPTDFSLNNYYYIYAIKDDLLALGFTATPFGDSNMIGILSQKGENKAVLEINLDLLFHEQSPNSSIYWSGELRTFDMQEYASNLRAAVNINKSIAQALHHSILETIS